MKLSFKFDIGMSVKIKILENSIGRVLGVRNFNQGNEYNVRYFINGEEKSIWFFEDELNYLQIYKP